MTEATAAATATAAAAAPGRRLVDAHAHVWNRARTPIDWIDDTLPEIDRDFSVSELEQTADDAARSHGVTIDGFVLVQALNDHAETIDLLANAHGPVVGWVDLDTGDTAERLAALKGAPGGDRLVGIRHLAHIDPDPEWLLRPAVSRGLDAIADAGLGFDLVVRPWQLPLAAQVADAHPQLRLVLDHLGQPPLSTDADAAADWERDLGALAERPNVVAKVSGIALRGADASRAHLDRVAGTALEAFGATRLLFGSDFPLVRLADGYEDWLGQYLAWSADLSGDEQRAIDSGTAIVAYGPAALRRS